MRTSLLAGGLAAVAAAIAVWLGEFFGLELESSALLGVALGAVIALVPDGRPGLRLAGFMGGMVVTWFVYFARAAVLPDTSGGRAVAAFLMLALCVGLVALSVGRLSLWSTLVGAAAMFGVYEQTFMKAPPEVVETSVSTLTSLVFTAAIGFLAAAFVAPGVGEFTRVRTSRRRLETNDRLDMMESAQ